MTDHDSQNSAPESENRWRRIHWSIFHSDHEWEGMPPQDNQPLFSPVGDVIFAFSLLLFVGGGVITLLVFLGIWIAHHIR